MADKTRFKVTPTPEIRTEIRIRASLHAMDVAGRLHQQALKEWAQSNDGPLPTKAWARAEAEEQIELLCHGLGRLAAVNPSEVDMASDQHRPRRTRPHRPEADWDDLFRDDRDE